MRVAVGFDESEGAESALQAALNVAAASNGALLLIRVFNPRFDAAEVFATSNADAAGIVVEEWRHKLDERSQLIRDVPVECLVQVAQRGEETGPALVRGADEWHADLIAIGSRRATGLSGALLGSVAAGVINASACPTLLVRP